MMPRFNQQKMRNRFACLARHLSIFIGLFLFIISPCHASPSLIIGQWYLVNQPSEPIKALPLTGGDFVFKGTLQVAQAGDYVIDFKNTSTFAMFQHSVRDSRNVVVAELQGGIGRQDIMNRH